MNSTRIDICCWAMVVIVVATGCKTKLNRSRETRDAVIESAPKASAAIVVTAAPAATAPAQPPSRLQPRGPAFAVEPGAGLGPIRFGSTVATVERHMQIKCEELTDKYCRYIASGIELELTNGAVSGIVIHRFDRPVAGDPDKKWGVFAGGIPPKVLMTMVPEAVIEQLGKPKRTETLKEDPLNWTVRRDTYDGLVLDYDKNRANDRLMLGQIRVVKR
jgi:hypothetical protein